ncbi:hypothetical protein AAFF_G00395610 [Aldrovandia affinis]|uniref:Uncharacterized protein n=1 Tax=Aldrovandia affinis TaxID=143900 RepID=A0AAD7WKP2_9TELE|nr:hypothetical protein AAFF_G00395610 [Aldrovandia affinis]
MWPKSSSKKEWATVDADLIKILDGVKGTVEKKLEKIGDLIYATERKGSNKTDGKEGHDTNHPSQVQKAARNPAPCQAETGLEEAVEESLSGGKSGNRPPANRPEGTPGKTAES